MTRCMQQDIQQSKYIILLGGNILNGGVVDWCREQGYKLIVVDWSAETHFKGDIFLQVDVKDAGAIIRELRRLQIDNIVGVYSSIDLAVPSINAIHQEYGMQHMDDAAIAHVQSKAAMTSIWEQHGLLNRISELHQEFSGRIVGLSAEYKLIFKPNVSSSSRGITIVERGAAEETLQRAFARAQEESFDATVIVEEFVEGREFTCEMLGDAYGNVCVYAISVKYHTENTTNNKIATKLHYNSNVYSDELYERIGHFGKQCYRALGMKSSFGHLELMMKEDGTLSPLEIGGRSSGYIANPLVSLASGQDFLGDYFKVVNGGTVLDGHYLNGGVSSMYFFYDMPHDTMVAHPCSLMDFVPAGVCSKCCNRDKVMTQGCRFTRINNDNERVGYEIICGERNLMSIANIEKAEREFINHNIGAHGVL